MHVSARVPCVNKEHQDVLQYKEDYRQAYNETWMIAWLLACSNEWLHGPDIALQTQVTAHTIAMDFADLKRLLRH